MTVDVAVVVVAVTVAAVGEDDESCGDGERVLAFGLLVDPFSLDDLIRRCLAPIVSFHAAIRGGNDELSRNSYHISHINQYVHGTVHWLIH